MTTTVDTATITVELPDAFDPRWNRLPGITVDGVRITIDPAEYFFRFKNSSWLVVDWATVETMLLHAEETPDEAVEQLAAVLTARATGSTSVRSLGGRGQADRRAAEGPHAPAHSDAPCGSGERLG